MSDNNKNPNTIYVVDLAWHGPVDFYGRPPGSRTCGTRTVTETVTIFRAQSPGDAARRAEIRTGKIATSVKSKGLIVWRNS